MIADTENNRLQVFSDGGQFKSRIGEKGSQPHQLNHPMCVALSRDGHENLLVTDSVNAGVKVYSLDGAFLTHYCECGTFDFPYGIAVTSCHYMVVTDICRHCVIVLYPSGCKKLQFGQYGDGLRDFDHPYFVTVNKDDQIIVSDSGNTTVKIFSTEGEILQKFNMFDFRLFEEHFVLLQGVTVDPQDNLIIIGNATVYIVAKNGRFWEVLLPQDGLHSPKCVAFSSHGQLVLTQCGLDQRHEISVFKYNMTDFRSLQSVPAGGFVDKNHVESNQQPNGQPETVLVCKKSAVVRKYKRTSTTSTSSTDDIEDRSVPES